MPIGRMSKEKEERGLSADQTNPGSKEDREKFSETVYRDSGIHRGPRGRKYSFMSVTSEEELEWALGDGWSRSLNEALFPEAKDRPAQSSATPKEIYNLYVKLGDWGKVTEETGVNSPWNQAKAYAEKESLAYPPPKKG